MVGPSSPTWKIEKPEICTINLFVSDASAVK